MRRVGHKGADRITPGNTLASFDSAVEHGADMIEFDVLPEDARDPRSSRLVLAHDYTHDLAAAPTLEEGLDHLVTESFADVDLDVVRGWWSWRSLAAMRWLMEHGYDPSAPGCEVDVLKAAT